MLYFGLIISIIFYISQYVILGAYFTFMIKKNYKYANSLLLILFLHSLVVVMVLSWALVLMNGGFDVNFYLNIDYTWLIIPFLVLFITIIFTDVILQKKLEPDNNILISVCRYLLPTFVILSISVGTLILYFNCHYFSYLNMYIYI